MVLSWRSLTSIHCWKWRKYLAGGSSKRKDALCIPSKIVNEGYFLFTHPDIRTLHPSLSSPFPTDWPSWIIFNEPPCPLTSSWVWPIGSPTRDVALFLSWVITPVGWFSPTVRALADFWLWCASPSLFTTRSGSGSKWMLHHPLFVSINPAHTTVSSSFTQFPSITLFRTSDLLPVGILKDAGRSFSFCGSRIVSQVRVISIKEGGRALYTF